MAETDPDFSSSELSEDQSLSEAEGMNDVLRVKTVNAPYQNEPLALGPQGEDDVTDVAEEEADEDGLSFETIQARYDKVEPVAQWFVPFFIINFP